MKRSVLAAAAAGLLAAAGCGDGNADGSRAAAALVSPSDVTIQDLQAEVSDERVRRFYEARGWQAVWTRDGAAGLIEAIESAQAHALDPAAFRRGYDSAQTAAAREAALTLAALDLADALANGRTDPNELRDIYTVPRPRPDLIAGLGGAIERGEAGAWIQGLAPQDAEYRALSEAYRRYASMAAQPGGDAIASGGLIREGDRDPRIPQIVEALRSNGYLAAAEGEGPQAEAGGSDDTLYTPAMAEAVRRMQEDFGLSTDGVVGDNTLRVLNTGPVERARTLAVNLERRRWLERRPPDTRIDVNTAAALLDFYRGGSHADQRRVVVGQPGWETPQLGSPIFRLVANPTWTVPKSIEEDEIAPQGPGYLARNNMVRRDGWIVQLPGPDNALGQVKFDMRNDHAIYLHDTPAKALFRENQRHFSHGCVRVDDALGFARMIAEADGKREEFERALATGDETFVPLSRPIPVRLLYHTAFVDRGGNIVFRTDAYGWDDDVAQALGLAGPRGPRLRTHVRDVGP